MWKELEELLAEHPAKWMIWEGEPRRQTVTRLAELGIDCATLAPCGNEPTKGDFLGVQRKHLSDLAKVYSEMP
jgi:zinc transport system substrate-binding protein